MVLRIFLRRSRSYLFTLVITSGMFLMLLTVLETPLFSPCTISPDYEIFNTSMGELEKNYYFSPLQQHAMRPFDDGAHYLLLLSYQRSGSSFFGQLFNQNRNIRFVYEPIDSVYVSLYGTPEGWNVPTDITNEVNGSERILPDHEVEAVGSTLHDLFTCNMQNLKTETLTHRFWKQFASFQYSTNQYARCMASRRAALRDCRGHIGERCGKRFGDSRFMDKCNSLMEESFKRWNGTDQNIDIQRKLDEAHKSAQPNDTSPINQLNLVKDKATDFPRNNSIGLNGGIKQRNLLYLQRKYPKGNMKWRGLGAVSKDSDMVAFMRYHSCKAKTRISVSRCVQAWTDDCAKSNVKVIKTVRATMESAEYLLDKIPNLRIIHLLRDPRAVMLSRSKFDGSASSIYAGKPMNMVKESKLFCRQVVRDIKLRQRLQLKYPGQIMEIIYDDFVLHPLEYTELVYKFANITLPDKTKSWVKKQTQNSEIHKKNATYIATKWQDKLSYRITKEITSTCQTFFDYVKYDWPE